MTDAPLPFVSVIIPCRNEARFIAACVQSVIDNDYPHERMELLMIDGMSDDGTREILGEFCRRHPFVRVIDNPNRITPAALNIGITAARGELILRMDAHAHLASTYISKSVAGIQTYDADNVGGVMHTVPQHDTLIGRAIVASLSHRFGVGNSYFRVHTSEPRYVVTVFGGCYKRDVFTTVGLFNEGLARGQDMEFNLRLKKAGLKTLLVPDIESWYFARADWRSFWRHNWNNGVWAVLPFLHSPIMPVTIRHLVPMFFALALVAFGAAAPFSTTAAWLFAGVSGAYALAALIAAVDVAVKRRDARLVFLMPLVFGSLHIAYGLGSLFGVLRIAAHYLGWRAAPATSMQRI